MALNWRPIRFISSFTQALFLLGPGSITSLSFFDLGVLINYVSCTPLEFVGLMLEMFQGYIVE